MAMFNIRLDSNYQTINMFNWQLGSTCYTPC